MIYNFCTLFDSNYLHKGLALYQSLTSVCNDFHLYVVAFDDICHRKLSELNLAQLTTISLAEFETEELLSVKPKRTRAEYCWTSGSSVIYHCIKNYNLDHCTYIDADMMFFQSPKIIFDEIGDNSIAITEHIPDGPDMPTGKYCVQFVYFKNDDEGMKVLTWWKNSCIDWCYSRYENGKFGDQKYLEYFSSLTDKVCVLKNRGAGVAPWNMHLYDFSKFGKIKYGGETTDIIFFHFHGIKIQLMDNKIQIILKDSDSTKSLEKNIYTPYLLLLIEVINKFLGQSITDYEVIGRSLLLKGVAKIKLIFRNCNFARFIYYRILRIKH